MDLSKHLVSHLRQWYNLDSTSVRGVEIVEGSQSIFLASISYECKGLVSFREPGPRTMEMFLPCTKLMKEIESAIMESMSNCLKELCKSNKVLAGEDVSVAQALSRSFDNKFLLEFLRVCFGNESKRDNSLMIFEPENLSQQLLKVDAVSFYHIMQVFRELQPHVSEDVDNPCGYLLMLLIVCSDVRSNVCTKRPRTRSERKWQDLSWNRIRSGDF